MRWNAMAQEQRAQIIDAAAGQLASEDEARQSGVTFEHVTVADLADFARGRRLRCAESALQYTLRADRTMRDVLDRLFDRYALVSVPPAIAASTGAPRRRRHADAQVEVEWAPSSAEPDSVYVRVYAPMRLRPVRQLVLRGEDGTLCKISLADDGSDEVIETLVDRHSPEFSLLQDEAAKLWLQ